MDRLLQRKNNTGGVCNRRCGMEETRKKRKTLHPQTQGKQYPDLEAEGKEEKRAGPEVHHGSGE